MDKLDILIMILAIASYFAIKIDARNYDTKVQRYESIRIKQKLYIDNILSAKTRGNSTKINNL